MTECVYCGCAVEAHDPVYVSRTDPRVADSDDGDSDEPSVDQRSERASDDGARRETDAYCNYGCLAAHIETAGLATGTACRVDL